MAVQPAWYPEEHLSEGAISVLAIGWLLLDQEHMGVNEDLEEGSLVRSNTF